MPDYEKDVEEDAKDFIENHDDVIIEAIAEYLESPGRSEINLYSMNLDDSFHEEVVDRSYSLEDAAFIISASDDPESDSGLWEGQEPADALSTQAAYTYGNDVRSRCEAILEEIIEFAEDLYHEDDDELREKFSRYAELEEYRESNNIDPEEREELIKLCDELTGKVAPISAENAAKQALDDYFKDQSITPITPGSDEEIWTIKHWLDLNNRAGLWGGYPVGSSYIDARCGSGHGMPDIKDYVDFDHEMAQKLPHLRNKGREQVRARLDELTQAERIEKISPLQKPLKDTLEQLVDQTISFASIDTEGFVMIDTNSKDALVGQATIKLAGILAQWVQT
jgi:hypothetical protein